MALSPVTFSTFQDKVGNSASFHLSVHLYFTKYVKVGAGEEGASSWPVAPETHTNVLFHQDPSPFLIGFLACLLPSLRASRQVKTIVRIHKKGP